MNRYVSTKAIVIFSLLLVEPAIAGGYGYDSRMSDMSEGEGNIILTAPKQGQSFDSGSSIQLKYTLKRSINGNHLHVYVDNESPIIVRKVNGCPCDMELPELAAGMHQVSVKEATASHALTGVESSVTFEVK